MDRWVTFDCYGTLIDWTSGMLAALQPVAGERAAALLGSYYRLEPPVAARKPHLPYRAVLAETLRQAADEQLIDLVPSDRDILARNWDMLGPFADTARELKSLHAAGWNLAVLTNCDDDLFAISAAQLGEPLDMAVTAQQVGSYKPYMRHFEEFAARTGATPATWVHVANSWMADMVPAYRLGLPRVWIDRDRSGHDETIANRWQHDLTDLAGAVQSAWEQINA